MKKRLLLKRTVLAIIAVAFALLIGFVIYDSATANNTYEIGERNLEIPIFVYHDIVKDKSEIKFDYMQTDVETFEKQLVGLKNVGYDFITYRELEQYKNHKTKLKKKSCIVTFDDGYESVYENVFPIVKKYNIPVTLYVITDNMEKPGVLTWQQAREMQESGLVTIASHSTNHPEFTNLTAEEAVENVKLSYNIIEEKLGKQETKIFTYPYGLFTDEQIEVLKNEGYIQNLTDNKINKSEALDLAKLHRCYPLSDSILKMMLKIMYRSIRYN